MGLFNGFSYHESELTATQIYLEYGSVLLEGETVDMALKLEKDKFVFTSLRLFIVRHCKSEKFEFLSVPYASIRKFLTIGKSIEDSAAELSIYIHGDEQPIKKVINNREIVNQVYKTLSQRVFGQTSLTREIAVVKMN